MMTFESMWLPVSPVARINSVPCGLRELPNPPSVFAVFVEWQE